MESEDLDKGMTDLGILEQSRRRSNGHDCFGGMSVCEGNLLGRSSFVIFSRGANRF